VPRVGGAPANVAVGLVRLGVPSAFVGALATDDPFAPMLLDRLATEGVDTRWVTRVSPAQTRLAVVTGPAGQRGFTFYGHPPADSLLRPDDLPAAAIAGAAALYLGALPLTAEPSRSAALRAVDLAVAAGVPVCFDPNPRAQFLAAGPAAREACWQIARAATVLKLSADDLTILGITPTTCLIWHRRRDSACCPAARRAATTGRPRWAGISPPSRCRPLTRPAPATPSWRPSSLAGSRPDSAIRRTTSPSPRPSEPWRRRVTVPPTRSRPQRTSLLSLLARQGITPRARIAALILLEVDLQARGTARSVHTHPRRLLGEPYWAASHPAGSRRHGHNETPGRSPMLQPWVA